MFEFNRVKYKNILDLPYMKIEKGKITTLTGQSGSGKTTILKLLNKMISPTEGIITYCGADLSRINSVAHRRNVIMLSQTPVIIEGTIKDNLNAGLMFQGMPAAADNMLNGVLEKVKLAKPLGGDAIMLSGGEKQRLALARVLLLLPEVYLLDEPSSALDDDTEEAVIEAVAKEVKERGKTLIMVTHSKTVAKRYSDEVINISRGRLSVSGEGGQGYGRYN